MKTKRQPLSGCFFVWQEKELFAGVTRGNRTLVSGTTNHCPTIER